MHRQERASATDGGHLATCIHRAEPAEHRHVLAEVSLHGENADPKRPLHGAKCS